MKTSDLLGHGYLPKQIPVGFSSQAWGDSHETKPLALPAKYGDCPLLTHTVSRPGQLPRLLGIPHPYHFHRLADLISSNWKALGKSWKKSAISLSIPRIGNRTKGERATEPTGGWKLRAERALEQRQGRKVLLRADVSQCYPSIYTHAVSWALQGKAAAILASKKPGGLTHFADLIDKAVRDGQERQSVGLPIGPDTSYLLAEVVLSEVDHLIQQRITNLQGIRIVDDYELYFDDVAQAERAKTILAESLASFRLLLNGRKTKVSELPSPLDPGWKRELSNTRFGGSLRESTKMIRKAADICFHQRQNEPDSRSLTYLLTMLAACEFHKDAWPLVQTVALASFEFEENSLPRAAKLFFRAKELGYKLDAHRLSSVLNRSIIRHNSLNYGNAAAWALSMMIHLDIPVAAEAVTSSVKTDDAVVLVLLAHAKAKGLASSFAWNTAAKAHHLSDCWSNPRWLFLYECVRHDWLGPKTRKTVEATLKVDPYLASLNKRKISFYREEPPELYGGGSKFRSSKTADAHSWSQIELLPDYEA